MAVEPFDTVPPPRSLTEDAAEGEVNLRVSEVKAVRQRALRNDPLTGERQRISHLSQHQPQCK